MSDSKPQHKNQQASALPADIPAEVRPFLEQMGYLDEDRLHVGDRAPLLTLEALDGSEPAVIGDPHAVLPSVLVFGSYT